MLKVKKLHPDAKLPTVAHPGEDLAYDLYALEESNLYGNCQTIRTGIAAQAYDPIEGFEIPLGLLIRDRSSMAKKGIVITGGVVDAGYTGEISVVMKNTRDYRYRIEKGDKIAQMIPIPVLTGEVIEVEELRESSRGELGFGSSGR